MFFVNEGYPTVQMVAGLKILSSGISEQVFGVQKGKFQIQDHKGNHNLFGVEPVSQRLLKHHNLRICKINRLGDRNNKI
jgi:hypothetical protein